MSESTRNSFQVPVIEINHLTHHNASDELRTQVLHEVRQACLQHGFFIAVGHGIPPSLQQTVLMQARLFFSLPDAEKLELLETKSFGRSHRGYQAVKGERLQYGKAPDLKEGFQIGVEKSKAHPDCKAQRMLTGPNVWPQPLQPAFSEAMDDYAHRMWSLQDQIMRIIAETLDVEFSQSFEAYCQDSLRGLRLLHYPPQLQETDLGAGAHTDFGALTILLTDGVGGLQFQDESEQWINIEPPPGSYVINLGDMMSRMTAGLYKSSVHRVINTSGKDRYSVPMFLDGNLDFVIEALVEGPKPPSNRLTVEEHMTERFGTARDAIKTGVVIGP